jgi:aspartyl/asparaginyl beta-hydroxylase (cupin superfamily)
MDEKLTTGQELVHEERRAFLKKAGTAAVAAPAAALMLSASSLPAQAQSVSGET